MPPAELAVCAIEPIAPDLPAHDWSTLPAAMARVRQRDELVLGYALALRSWGGDCQADVNGLAAWRERARDPSRGPP